MTFQMELVDFAIHDFTYEVADGQIRVSKSVK